MKTDELKSTTNSQSIECDISSAFRVWECWEGCEFETRFEHGQWWVLERVSSIEGEPAGIWSVNDATGPGSTFGYSFERVN